MPRCLSHLHSFWCGMLEAHEKKIHLHIDMSLESREVSQCLSSFPFLILLKIKRRMEDARSFMHH